MARGTVRSRRERNSWMRQAIDNVVRLAAVTAADAVSAWQLGGHEDDQGNTEVFEEVEVFQQVGFASRPKRGTGLTGAIVAALSGGVRGLALIASRDSTGRPTVDEDETALHNSLSYVRITKDGDVIVRVAAGRTVTIDDGGGAAALALKTDVDALRTVVNAHVHSGVTTGPGASGPLVTPAGPSVGTAVLKGK